MARSALNCLRYNSGAALLGDIAADGVTLTHEALDAHPRPRAAHYLRRILVAHHVLPDRDDDRARFQRWTAKLLADVTPATDHVADVTVPVVAAATGPAMAADVRWHIARRLLHDDTIELTDRVAGSLVLLYAQQLSRIIALTTDDIDRRDESVTVRLGVTTSTCHNRWLVFSPP